MPAEYVLPAGLLWSNPPDPLPEEGFELQFRKDDDPPQYFFCAQVSSLRIERVLADALRCLPPKVHAVVEMRRTDAALDAEPDGPESDRWTSPLLPLPEVLRVLVKFSFQILHDGRIGFGAYDPDSPLEVFLDDHKLLNLFAAELDPFSAVLERHRVPQLGRIASILDVEHEHVSLSDLPDRCPEPRREWLRRRRYDPRWFAPALRRSLRMKPVADPPPGEEDDDEQDADDGGDVRGEEE